MNPKKARYLDPKNDLTFRKIFGQRPHLLISFLNSMLPLEEGQVIEEIEYTDNEMLPELPGFKRSMNEELMKSQEALMQAREELVQSQEELIKSQEELIKLKEELAKQKEEERKQKEEALIKLAKTLIKQGLNLEVVAKETGLDMDRINRLQG